MKLKFVFLMLCILFFVSVVPVLAQEASELEERKVLIVGSSKDYQQLVETAKSVSTKIGMPYSTRGMIFDAKRGLILPDNHPDESYAGSYLLRRYTADCDGGAEECLTIEKSDDYDGFAPGLYILVAGIYESNDPVLAQKLATIQKSVPDAYAKSTKIFMGCMH